MANKKIIGTCFSEKETALSVLNFQKERRTVYKRHLGNESFTLYYSLLIKYLLSLNSLSITDVKKVIKRHIAITSYMYISDKISHKWGDWGKWCFRVKDLEHRLDNNLIDLDFLLTSESLSSTSLYDNPFVDLFVHDDFKKIKEAIVEINKVYENYIGTDNPISSLLNTILDYFCYGCKFADLKYYNHSDLIIAHHLVDGNCREFSFECDEKSLEKYWISNDPFKEIDIKEKIFGHIINLLIETNNFDFSKPIKIMQPYYYEIMLNIVRKKLIQHAFSFFEVNTVECTATINTRAIEEDIHFKYNNIEYTFGKNGIRKI